MKPRLLEFFPGPWYWMGMALYNKLPPESDESQIPLLTTDQIHPGLIPILCHIPEMVDVLMKTPEGTEVLKKIDTAMGGVAKDLGLETKT